VEIERLVNENNSLKAELKAAYEANCDRIQYELQIKDLLAKIQSLLA
jgi:hypothetical protein